MEFKAAFDAFITAIKNGVELGDAVMVVLILWGQAHIYSQYKGRLADRQKEIDKVTAENRQYRERFIALLDKKFGFVRKNQAQKKK